jgi:hypothetical protein
MGAPLPYNEINVGLVTSRFFPDVPEFATAFLLVLPAGSA